MIKTSNLYTETDFLKSYQNRYDKHINPSENVVTIFGAIGEGFHNYHHTFPWDYATSELGWKFNLTTIFIDFFARIGWAYDRFVKILFFLKSYLKLNFFI